MKTILVDEKACWGCQTCELACKQEMHTAADGVRLIRVAEDGPRIENGTPFFTYRVHMCRHCDDPPCVDVCPEDAIAKRSDGIVVLDEIMCTGCQICISSCPYDAIDFDDDRNIAQKCNLCHHRVDQGLVPACADNICLAIASFLRSGMNADWAVESTAKPFRRKIDVIPGFGSMIRENQMNALKKGRCAISAAR